MAVLALAIKNTLCDILQVYVAVEWDTFMSHVFLHSLQFDSFSQNNLYISKTIYPGHILSYTNLTYTSTRNSTM